MVVDEAHAIGALGPGGRGAVAEAGLEGEVDVVVGTLGKALGSYGAYVCASERDGPLPDQHGALADLLDRPAAAGGRRRAGGAGAARRAAASRRASERGRAGCAARSPREGFPVAEGEMHIVPLIVGEERAAMRMCEEAIERGVFAQAIRPPTVPRAPRGCA